MVIGGMSVLNYRQRAFVEAYCGDAQAEFGVPGYELHVLVSK